MTAAYSCSATIGSSAGDYPIVPSLVDPNNRQTNYAVNLVSGTLTVAQPTSVITWISIVGSGGSVYLEFSGIPGDVYFVQSAARVTGPWTDLSGPLTAGPTGVIIFTDTQPDSPKFYRTRVGP
jgi:hypothetical protein